MCVVPDPFLTARAGGLPVALRRRIFLRAGQFLSVRNVDGVGTCFLACLALILTGVIADVERAFGDEVSDAGVRYFETHIRPLFAERCYSCHSRQADKREGGLSLDSRESWLAGGDRGAAVVPGDPDGSLLIQAVRYADSEFQMPPTEKIPDEGVALLENWVRMGAPAPAGDTAPEFIQPSDPVAGKSHWAFQPLVAGVVPNVQDTKWPRTEIDQFILAGLEMQQLHPVRDASPGDLVRRLSFQLTGLPPAASHIEAYQNSPVPETLEVIVDELLASPQFGPRWGRHWLDLARYADSNGLDENFLFREAWRYRNQVIDAFNSDMPFDRFLLEQLAGDLLPYDSTAQRDRQRTASGFLVIGPKVLLGVNPQKQRMDVADEQIETIGRAVLGQTLGCARCHDHKFDPVPTADYYALAGILTSTQVMEQRYMLGAQRVMERLVGLGDDGGSADDKYEEYWRNRDGMKARQQKVKAALDLLKANDPQTVTAALAADAEGFADAAKDPSIAVEQRIIAQEKLLQQLTESIDHPPAIPARAMIPSDADEIRDESIRLAGKFDVPGDRVPRGFLQVLSDGSVSPLSADSSGRIELARWLTDTGSRAGWLTARVQANRVWYHLTGRGLVRTVDNFGRTGEVPSHPELLDYLATKLIEDGWSLKSLIRRIVLSRTFGLSSSHDETCNASDPENRLLWRAHRRRLDPESLRDAMLTASGTLDLTPMESTVAYLGDQATAVGTNPVRRRTDFNCRSVYLPVIRNDLPELFDVFDFANPHLSTGARPNTTVPTQGLFMLNDAMVMAAAEATARRAILETGSEPLRLQIERVFQVIVNSPPSEQERQFVQSFVEQAASRLRSSGDPDPEVKALALACHAVFASSRFQFLE